MQGLGRMIALGVAAVVACALLPHLTGLPWLAVDPLVGAALYAGLRGQETSELWAAAALAYLHDVLLGNPPGVSVVVYAPLIGFIRLLRTPFNVEHPAFAAVAAIPTFLLARLGFRLVLAVVGVAPAPFGGGEGGFGRELALAPLSAAAATLLMLALGRDRRRDTWLRR